MKKMIKSALALVAAVLFGGATMAAESELQLSYGETNKVVTGLHADPHNYSTTDAKIAAVGYSDGVVWIAGGNDGEATVTVGSDAYNVKVATVDITKTVIPDPNNKSNATIRIVSHILRGVAPQTPNVLFLGTRCNAHDLVEKTVVDSLNGLKSVANVDYYLFDNSTSDSATYAVSNSVAKGGAAVTQTNIGSLKGSNHSALKGVYNVLQKIKKSGVKYDYIVIETDGSRLAYQYNTSGHGTADPAQEYEVAAYLADFYADERVIWVLDNGFDYYHSTTTHYYFEYAKEDDGYAQEIFQYGSRVPNGGRKYRATNTFLRNNGSGSGPHDQYLNRLGDDQWKGLLGIFDPQLYLDIADKKQTELYAKDEEGFIGGAKVKASDSSPSWDLYAGHSYNLQLWYDDAEHIGENLANMIKPITFSAKTADSVLTINDSLTIPAGADSIIMYQCKTNAQGIAIEPTKDSDWVKVNGVGRDGNMVTGTIDKIDREWWTRIDIKVHDNGTFFLECYANNTNIVDNGDNTYDLDPNDGSATVSMTRTVDGVSAPYASNTARTSVPWRRTVYPVTLTVMGAEKDYDGKPTNVTTSVTANGTDLAKDAYKLLYSRDNGKTWSDTNPQFTHVSETQGAVGTNVPCKVKVLDVFNYLTNCTPKSATVKIKPITVTVTAGSTNKVYDATPDADFTALGWSVTGAVDGETDLVNDLVAASITNKQGQTAAFKRASSEVDAKTYGNDIVLKKDLKVNDDYVVNFTPGTFTINPAQIKGFHFSDTKGYNAATAPAVLAENIDCYVEDLPAGGTNITVKLFKPFGFDTFTPKNLNENRNEVGVYTNWCTVSGGDNYLSTNVCAEIIIRKREPEVAGDTTAANETEIKGKLLEIAKGIANAKTPMPVYAEARLTIDDATGGADETEIENNFRSVKEGNVENVQSASYDIKLEYTEDYKDPKNWEDIGSSNNTKIKIVLDCPLVKTAETVEVWRKHNGKISKANWTDGTASVDKSKGQVTINVSKFSVYTVITYSIPPPECGPCNPCPEEEVAPTLVYKVQMNLKTTKGVTTHETVNKGSICTPSEDEDVCNVYRTKDATKLVGWIYDCTATCDTIANGSVAIWDAKRKAPFADGAAFTTTFINVMGKKQAEAEWAWTFSGTADYSSFDAAATQEYALTGAGLGKFSAAKGYYTSFSGRVAGTVTASWDLKTKKNNCCISSQIAKCDNLATLVDAQDTIAYGTWSAKYDSSASKRYAKDGYLKLPSYAK